VSATPLTYDETLFQALAYEFGPDDRREAERKIRRALKRHRLGTYNQERVDEIRSLKDELQSEIGRFAGSKYYLNSTGPVADMANFDFERMLADYSGKYPRIARAELGRMLNIALYVYYLR